MIITSRIHSLAFSMLLLLCGSVVAQSVVHQPMRLQFAQAELKHGPVKSNETLWSIARRYAPDEASVSRMTVSIFRANPGAFTDNNINLLKKGAMLTIPAAPAALSSVGRQEAVEVLQSHSDASGVADRQLAPVKAVPKPPVTTEIVAVTSPGGAANGGSEALETAVETVPAAPARQQSVPSNEMNLAVPVVAAVTNEPAPSTPSPPGDHEDHHTEIVTRLSYDVSAIYDDNIRRSTYADDIRDDYMLNLTLNGKLLFATGEYSNLTLGGRLGLEKFATFNKLDSALGEISLKYAFAFSSSFSAPTYALKLQLGTQDFESEMRDADFATFGFEASSQLTDKLFLIGGFKAKQRESRSRVFDTREDQLFVNADLALSRRNLVYLTYHYIAGDLVSTATPRLAFINTAEVIEPDDAYGGLAFDQFAYRLDATTQVITLGFNRAVKRGLTFDLSLRYATSEADDSAVIQYDRSILRGGFIGRF